MVCKIEFKINREKGVVVCIVETRGDIAGILYKYGWSPNLIANSYEKKFYKGIARCAPEDEWDEIYGKRLAEYRAMTKRRRYINREIKRFWKEQTRKLNNLYRYGFLDALKEPEMAVNADG